MFTRYPKQGKLFFLRPAKYNIYTNAVNFSVFPCCPRLISIRNCNVSYRRYVLEREKNNPPLPKHDVLLKRTQLLP
jgi:hypothetical protein